MNINLKEYKDIHIPINTDDRLVTKYGISKNGNLQNKLNYTCIYPNMFLVLFVHFSIACMSIKMISKVLIGQHIIQDTTVWETPNGTEVFLGYQQGVNQKKLLLQFQELFCQDHVYIMISMTLRDL